jgi:transcription elongation GreA/GreB family factor
LLKKTDGDDTLPDRPISPNRNFVTEAGLAAIEEALARFEAEHREAIEAANAQAAAAALREIHYWRARRANAEVVKPSDRSKASFGTTVTLRRSDGQEQRFQIVGEDEANPRRGTLSYVSRLARAASGHLPGEALNSRVKQYSWSTYHKVRPDWIDTQCRMCMLRRDPG